MEIGWNTGEDFEAAMKGLDDSQFLQARLEDERKLFATNSNPVCIVEEYDSPVGPDNLIPLRIPTIGTSPAANHYSNIIIS
jgi:hypothetical protein